MNARIGVQNYKGPFVGRMVKPMLTTVSGSARGWGEPARGNVPAGGKPVQFQSRGNFEESVYYFTLKDF